MSNSSDKDKADWGNDTAPDAPYEVGNKKPPRAVQARFFWQSEGSPERKRQSSHAGSAGAAEEHRGDQERTAYTDAGLGRHRQSPPRVVDEGRSISLAAAATIAAFVRPARVPAFRFSLTIELEVFFLGIVMMATMTLAMSRERGASRANR